MTKTKQVMPDVSSWGQPGRLTRAEGAEMAEHGRRVQACDRIFSGVRGENMRGPDGQPLPKRDGLRDLFVKEVGLRAVSEGDLARIEEAMKEPANARRVFDLMKDIAGVRRD